MHSKRILVIANKWWEADPLCAVLIHDKARPKVFNNFKFLQFPALRFPKLAGNDQRPADPIPIPRIIFNCDGAVVEVWCIEELVNPSESSSSSAEKARVLPGAINYGPPPDIVIAFGTAGSHSSLCVNGSVIVGTKTFIHDALENVSDKTRLWTPPHKNQIIDSDLQSGLLGSLDEQFRHIAEARFLTCPVQPANPPLMVVSESLVSLGVVNVLNPNDYVWADEKAVKAFIAAHALGQIGSIETTHGVIRSASNAPFLYVSGIANAMALFDYQVRSRFYSQAFVASHNAAVAVAWLIPELTKP